MTSLPTGNKQLKEIEGGEEKGKESGEINQPETTSLPGLRVFTASTDPRDAEEIVLGEDRVVEGKQGRALELGKGGGEKGVGGMGASVEAEADGGGAGVVGILDDLLEDGGALGVVEENLPDTAGKVNLLTEVLDEDRRRDHLHRAGNPWEGVLSFT